MKDSDRVWVIFAVFTLLALAGVLAFRVGNISGVAFSIFEFLFCLPIMVCLIALAGTWEGMGE